MESLIWKHDRIVSDVTLKITPPGFPLGAANLKYVRKIRVKLNSNGFLNRRVTVISDADSFVTGSSPEKLAAKDVKRAPGNHQLVLAVDVRIRQVDCQEIIVLLDIGTQK